MGLRVGVGGWDRLVGGMKIIFLSHVKERNSVTIRSPLNWPCSFSPLFNLPFQPPVPIMSVVAVKPPVPIMSVVAVKPTSCSSRQGPPTSPWPSSTSVVTVGIGGRMGDDLLPLPVSVTVTQCEVSWRTCNCLPQVVWIGRRMGVSAPPFLLVGCQLMNSQPSPTSAVKQWKDGCGCSSICCPCDIGWQTSWLSLKCCQTAEGWLLMFFHFLSVWHQVTNS